MCHCNTLPPTADLSAALLPIHPSPQTLTLSPASSRKVSLFRILWITLHRKWLSRRGSRGVAPTSVARTSSQTHWFHSELVSLFFSGGEQSDGPLSHEMSGDYVLCCSALCVIYIHNQTVGRMSQDFSLKKGYIIIWERGAQRVHVDESSWLPKNIFFIQ